MKRGLIERGVLFALVCVIACGPAFAADVKEVKLDKDQQSAVDKLRAKGAAVMQIAADTDALAVNLGIVGKQATDAEVALVAKLPKVQQLDLHNTGVTDAGLASIAGLKTLTHLHLNGTAVTDAGVASLKGLEALVYLNLYNTAVTDEGLKSLAGLKQLKRVYLWQTKVTDAGAKALKSAIPEVYVNRGEELALPPPPPPADPKPADPKPDPAKPDPAKPDPAKPAKKGKKGAAAKAADFDGEGFIKSWLILGPIAIEGSGGEAIDKPLVPGEASLAPNAGDKVKVGTAELAWKAASADDYFLDFNALLSAEGKDNVGVYAVAYVVAPDEIKDVTVLWSSNDEGKAFLNGKELGKFAEGRSLEKDAEKASGQTLKKGTNVVILKVINESNNWQGCARLVDKAGKPVAGLKLAAKP